MFLKPQKLGNDGLSEEELLADRKNCKKIGPCGVGKKALYLNSFYIDRQYYIPVRSVSRVFKRVAMSKRRIQRERYVCYDPLSGSCI